MNLPEATRTIPGGGASGGGGGGSITLGVAGGGGGGGLERVAARARPAPTAIRPPTAKSAVRPRRGVGAARGAAAAAAIADDSETIGPVVVAPRAFGLGSVGARAPA